MAIVKELSYWQILEPELPQLPGEMCSNCPPHRFGGGARDCLSRCHFTNILKLSNTIKYCKAMTTLIAWVGVDSQRIGSVYIASDSRITWMDYGDCWDSTQKVFSSRFTLRYLGIVDVLKLLFIHCNN